MRQILRPAALILTAFWFHPALAQVMPGANAVGAGLSPPAPTQRPQVQDTAPAALPGVGNIGGIATAPKLAKTNSGDPTTDLFTAINANNYADAQDAISRGADLNAQDPLGESPLDLSIALNHNNITFMILSARNEAGASPTTNGPAYSLGSPSKAPAKKTAATKPTVHTVPVKMATVPAPAKPAPTPTSNAATDPGQANVSVGFLGFGQK